MRSVLIGGWDGMIFERDGAHELFVLIIGISFADNLRSHKYLINVYHQFNCDYCINFPSLSCLVDSFGLLSNYSCTLDLLDGSVISIILHFSMLEIWQLNCHDSAVLLIIAGDGWVELYRHVDLPPSYLVPLSLNSG